MSIQKIMLIDDEEDIRTIAELSLANIGGFDVLLVDNGAEGLKLATSETPDLILLDVVMPGMDGPEVIKVLKSEESTKDIPVIFMTAKTEEDEVLELISLGAVAVIAKPFDPMTLPDQIREKMSN